MGWWLRWLFPWWWPDAGLPGASRGGGGDRTPNGSLGVGWRVWGRTAVASWLVLFVVSWVGVLRAWDGDTTSGIWLLIVFLGGVAGANGVPGAAALLSPGVRQRLLKLPEAAALASLTLSAVVGLGGFAAANLWMGGDAGLIGTGIVIGVVSFPLTFGLAFPLGIPLVCSFLVWSAINGRGHLSRTAFVFLTAVSVVGWAGVLLIGVALGVGA